MAKRSLDEIRRELDQVQQELGACQKALRAHLKKKPKKGSQAEISAWDAEYRKIAAAANELADRGYRLWKEAAPDVQAYQQVQVNSASISLIDQVIIGIEEMIDTEGVE